jgi:rRNA maturation protein Nop10
MIQHYHPDCCPHCAPMIAPNWGVWRHRQQMLKEFPQVGVYACSECGSRAWVAIPPPYPDDDQEAPAWRYRAAMAILALASAVVAYVLVTRFPG